MTKKTVPMAQSDTSTLLWPIFPTKYPPICPIPDISLKDKLDDRPYPDCCMILGNHVLSPYTISKQLKAATQNANVLRVRLFSKSFLTGKPFALSWTLQTHNRPSRYSRRLDPCDSGNCFMKNGSASKGSAPIQYKTLQLICSITYIPIKEASMLPIE